MMRGTTEVILKTLLISVVNVFAVYISTFTYKLSWIGVMAVMILASLLADAITDFIFSKEIVVKGNADPLIGESPIVIGVIFGGALIAPLIILMILTIHFNFLEAVGISFISLSLNWRMMT